MWYLLAVILFLICPRVVEGDVLINEFSPETVPQTVELVNTSSQSADISGWYIDDDGGSTYYTVAPETIIFPQSCILLSGSFNLNKATADTVRLFNNIYPPTASGAQTLDSFSYKTSPGIGNSYARIPDMTGDWTATSSSFGMTNIGSKPCLIQPTPTPALSPTPVEQTQSSFSSSTQSEINNIWISEVLCFPEAGSPEWVELYNNNDTAVSLSGWFIDDGANVGSSPKKITLFINPYSYASVEMTSSLFNNDKDSVRLLDPQMLERDGFEYANPKQGTSLSRISWDNDEFCITAPTRNLANALCTEKPGLTPHQPSSSSSSSRSFKSVSASTINKTAISSYTQNNSPSSVLGVFTDNVSYMSTPDKPPSPIPHLSFLSISYSILTITSVLIKIRNGP